MSPTLLDAGPLAALFDPADPAHAHYRSLLSSKCGSATLLDPHGGRPASAGLGALSSKRGSATLLDPRGGRPASAGLGAPSTSSTAWHLTTTWPCVVEASHFLGSLACWRMLRWIEEGGATVFPFDSAHLAEMLVLMQRYTDGRRTQMDLADATLVWAAQETGVLRVWTLDVRDFSRYRLSDGRAFEIL